MPGGDGTGPLGSGPVGWGRGPCGRGLGRMAGPFGGYRYGARRMGRAGWGFGYYGPAPAAPGVSDERAWLEAEAKRLEALLSEVRAEIRDYKEEESD